MTNDETPDEEPRRYDDTTTRDGKRDEDGTGQRDRMTRRPALLHPKRGRDEARDEEQDETPHAPLYPTRGTRRDDTMG